MKTKRTTSLLDSTFHSTEAKRLVRFHLAAARAETTTTCGSILPIPVVWQWRTTAASVYLSIADARGIAYNCRLRRCTTSLSITGFRTTSMGTSKTTRHIAGQAIVEVADRSL